MKTLNVTPIYRGVSVPKETTSPLYTLLTCWKIGKEVVEQISMNLSPVV